LMACRLVAAVAWRAGIEGLFSRCGANMTHQELDDGTRERLAQVGPCGGGQATRGAMPPTNRERFSDTAARQVLLIDWKRKRWLLMRSVRGCDEDHASRRGTLPSWTHSSRRRTIQLRGLARGCRPCRTSRRVT
jgi:hypothetical protein